MPKRKARIAQFTGGTIILTGGIVLAVATSATPTTQTSTPIAIAQPIETVVYEDEPGWNCYTNGNESCGDVLTFVSDGAVLGAATDGKVYVSWKDGTVTHATQEQRYAAWGKCLDDAWYNDDPSDEAMQECDDSFMEPGDMPQFANWDTDGEYEVSGA